MEKGLDSGGRTGLRGEDWTQEGGLSSGGRTKLRRGLDSEEDWTQEGGTGLRRED